VFRVTLRSFEIFFITEPPPEIGVSFLNLVDAVGGGESFRREEGPRKMGLISPPATLFVFFFDLRHICFFVSRSQ